MRYILTSLVAGLALFACDDHIFSNGKGHTSTSETEGNAESLLINACSSCHGGGLAPNLATDICENLVNVPSTQAPDMPFVTPNDPANSYLWHKLNGTGGTVGGTDTIMPTTGALAAADLAIIEDWINNGAVCGAEVEEGEVNVANGESIVTNSCNNCHGTGPLFADIVPNVTDGEIVNAIQYGVGSMPPQGAVTNYEIVDVVAYLRATHGEYVPPVEDTGEQDTGGDTGEQVDLQAAAADIFNASCTGYCHGGSQAPDLSGDLCASVVDVDAGQLSSMKYVTSGDPANSYLWHKVSGTAGTAGGIDSIMPPGGSLSADDLQILEDWITSGVDCP